jgi:hypothetical protein
MRRRRGIRALYRWLKKKVSRRFQRNNFGLKFQIPSTNIQRNSKFQAPRDRFPNASSRNGANTNWLLMFGDSLDVGAWCLAFLLAQYTENVEEPRKTPREKSRGVLRNDLICF